MRDTSSDAVENRWLDTAVINKSWSQHLFPFSDTQKQTGDQAEKREILLVLFHFLFSFFFLLLFRKVKVQCLIPRFRWFKSWNWREISFSEDTERLYFLTGGEVGWGRGGEEVAGGVRGGGEWMWVEVLRGQRFFFFRTVFTNRQTNGGQIDGRGEECGRRGEETVCFVMSEWKQAALRPAPKKNKKEKLLPTILFFKKHPVVY